MIKNNTLAFLDIVGFQEEEEEAPAAPTGPSLYSVKLVKFDDSKKVALIKEIKNLMTGMNLVQVSIAAGNQG